MVLNLHRNPFWKIVQQELPQHGFPKYEGKQGNHDIDLTIHGICQGQPSTIKYIVPRICRSFTAERNFRAKLRNFITKYFLEIGFTSADPRFQVQERKSTYIAHINHDRVKKPLTTPKNMLIEAAAMAEGKVPDSVMIVPYIPSTYVGDKTIVQPRRQPNEPVSDTQVLAMFLVDAKDLSLLIEVNAGTALFKGSKPAPLRLLGITEAPVVVKEEPAIVLQPESNVIQMAEKRPGGYQGLIAARIATDPTRVWKISDFKDLVKLDNSIAAMLSLLTTAKKIRRTGRGEYMAPLKKVARK